MRLSELWCPLVRVSFQPILVAPLVPLVIGQQM